MRIFRDSRIIYAGLLRFCEIGIFITTLSYISYGLLGRYGAYILPYFYFVESSLALAVLGLSRRRIQQNLQQYANYYFITAMLILSMMYVLVSFSVSGIVFITSVFLSVFLQQCYAVAGNTITLAYTLREFKNVANYIIICAGASAMFFAIVLFFVITLFGGDSLIIVAAALYLICLVISRQLRPLHKPKEILEREAKPFKSILFRYLFAYVLIIEILKLLIDYNFRFSLTQNFDGSTIAIVSVMVIAAAGFLIALSQLMSQRRILRRYGAVRLLFFLPMGLILLGTLTFIKADFTLVMLMFAFLTVVFHSYNYLAYNTILNAIPRNCRVFGRFILYLFGYSIAGIAAIFLMLLSPYATIRIVVGMVIFFSLLSLYFIKYIKENYKGSLKLKLESRRYMHYDAMYATEAPNIYDVDEIIPEIGHSLSIYDALLHLEKLNINPVPPLANNLETTEDLINCQRRIDLLCKLTSDEVESALIRLLESHSLFIHNAIAKYTASRALTMDLSQTYQDIIRARVTSESQTIIALRRLMQNEISEDLLFEVRSRLHLAEERIFNWLASMGDTKTILNILPSVMGQVFVKTDLPSYAKALELIEIIFDEPSLTKLLVDTFESHYDPLSNTEMVQFLSQDPWLSQVKHIADISGAIMNINQITIFLRRVELFERLSAEILQLIAEILQVENMEKDQLIFSEGDQGDKLYWIASGEVYISFKKEGKTTLSKNAVFGELSLLDNSPRRASAIAKTDVVLLTMKKDEFLQLIEDIPLLSKTLIKQLMGYIKPYDDLY